MAKWQRVPATAATLGTTAGGVAARPTRSPDIARAFRGRYSIASISTSRCRRFRKRILFLRNTENRQRLFANAWRGRAECSCAGKGFRTLDLRGARSKSERGSTRKDGDFFATPFRGSGCRRERTTACSRSRARSRTCSCAPKCALRTWPKHFGIAAFQRPDRPTRLLVSIVRSRTAKKTHWNLFGACSVLGS